MLFNSFHFLFLFLPITMVGYHLLGRFGSRPVIAWLAVMSVVFYGFWNRFFVLFLLGSVLVNYLVALWITATPPESGRRTGILTLGIGANLVALFYFKYLYKTALLINALHLAKLQPHPVLLPLGISFFTFTQISYLVDLAEGQAERQDLLSYLLFVTFFPHLIAGPILHHKEMMPQFAALSGGGPNSPERPRRFALHAEDVSIGFTWFLMGLAKKVLIADKLAPTSDAAFSHTATLSAANAWVGIIVYSMQLYFDFSGYSDMALGLARMFSIRFPLNFDSPYKATSVTEYWQRWHMTLTRYITLYLYNPLLLSVQRRRAENGKKISRKALATFGGFSAMVAYPTMVTMLLTGIWHGAGLQFVVFGLIHGVYLTASQAWRHFRHRAAHGGTPARATGFIRLSMMIGVYLQVIFALIFFRSDSLHNAFAFLGDMFAAHGTGHADELLAGAFAFCLFPVVWFFPNTQQLLRQETGPHGIAVSPGTPNVNPSPAPTLFAWVRWTPSISWALVMAAVFFAVLANLDSTVRFLYFQF